MVPILTIQVFLVDTFHGDTIHFNADILDTDTNIFFC